MKIEVDEVITKEFKITLGEHEASTLHNVLRNIGGCGLERDQMMDLYCKLRDAGAPLKSLKSTGSIYLNQ
jgi:hypothetical protein